MRPLARAVVVGLGAVALVTVGAPAAWADFVRPLPDPRRPGVAVGVTTETGQGADGGGTCRFYRWDAQDAPTLVAAYQAAHPGERGAVYTYSCATRARPSPALTDWFAESAADPEALAQEAARRLRLPAPRLGTNPPPDAQQPPLVNLPVWLWVEPSSWQPVQATASVPGLSATVRAQPVRVIWMPGDGSRVACQGPGQPYTPERAGRRPPCGHTYTQPGRYALTATVTYQVRWSSPAGGGAMPPVTASSSLSLPVAEVQALN